MIGGGITNTLDLGGGQKIQDYLAGAGVSNQGPGGGTLYTQGQGFNPRPVIDTSSQQYQDLFEKYRPGFNEEYAGKMLGTQDRTYLNLPSAQDMRGLGYYDPNPMTRMDKTPMMAEFMNNLYRQPASGDANLGFGSVQNPGGISAMEAGIAGMIPAAEPTPTISQQQPVLQQLLGPGGNPMQPITGDTSEQPLLTQPGPSFDNMFLPLFGEQEQQPGGGISNEVEQTPVDSFGIGSNPIINNPIAPIPSMPTAPNTQPGHSHDDLLSGIGKLFEQYFPQQGSQQINQPSPMFDAAGNSVPDGQTQSSQVFGNMITPNFGGGY